MFCTQCGSKIEDGFKFCPECGNSIGESQNQQDNRTDLEKIADEICAKYLMGKKITSTHRHNAIKEFRRATGLGNSEATDIIYIRKYGKTYSQMRKEKKEQDRQDWAEINANFENACNKISTGFGGSKEVRCPKCRSTSISYGQKPSIGGAAIGYGLAGGAGAVVGGMTGKKGYAVCLKCGKRWKI